MRIFKLFSLVILSAVLAACSSIPKIDANDSQAVYDAITIERDDFKKLITYEGPNAVSDHYLDKLYIRAWDLDELEYTEYQIYVVSHYGKRWRRYDSAYDTDGKRLEAKSLTRKVDSCSRMGCSYYEHVAIDVTKEYLEQNKDSGIHFKISGQGGEAVYLLPAGYIQAFLEKTK